VMNRARQDALRREIMEIVGGARGARCRSREPPPPCPRQPRGRSLCRRTS
jgi:hypothetical protein